MAEHLEGIKALWPRGDNVWMAKERDESVTEGGIIIPDAHQEYRRRGWCIVPGGGCYTKDGVLHEPPYKPGDYLICDRHFVRPDEREDEITRESNGAEITVLVRGDEVTAFVPGKKKPAPEWARKIIERFANQPGLHEEDECQTGSS